MASSLNSLSSSAPPSAIGGGSSTTTGLVTSAVFTGTGSTPLDPTIRVSSMSIHNEINKIPFAKIVVLDGDPSAGDFPISDLDTLAPGQPITVQLGYNSNNVDVFSGVVVTHAIRVDRKGTSLHLDCKDLAVKMTMVPNNKHYNNVTDSDLATTLIGNYSDLTANVSPTSVSNENLVQCAVTDWDFMISRMDRMGMITVVNEGEVIIAAPDPTSTPVIDLEYGVNILEFSATLDARTQVQSVQLSNWDSPSQSVISTTSQFQPPATEEGNIDASDLANALSIALLDMRTSAAFTPDEAQAVADARQMKNVLAKVQGRVKFQGFNGIMPGDMVTLGRLGDRFNGPAFVRAVHHEFSNGNWTTEATLGMPLDWFSEKLNSHGAAGSNTPVGSVAPNVATGLFGTLQGLQVGVVNSITDPDNEFRVQVKLPAVNADDDGVWARVATLDAGDSRGTFFRPEVGDEMIVGFINADPSQPIILGMMNSSALAAPLTPSQSNDQKCITTRSGIAITFDDGQNSVVIATPGGRQLTLNDNSGSVELTDGQGNTLSFGSSGVTLQAQGDLTIQAGGNLSITGNQLSATGQSSMSLSSTSVSISGSGETSISGGLVKIN